jgi:hypothetical protein
MSEDRAKPHYQVEPAADEPADIHALDVCPKCGASLPDITTLVCLRCGFDLKTMKAIDTKVGVEAAAEEVGNGKRAPLAAPGRGDRWLPLALAGASVLVLVIGFLAGADGLFAGVEPARATRRLLGLSRAVMQIALLTVAGAGALVAMARLLGTTLGDVRLAAARMLGIIAVLALARFLNLNSDALEWSFETLIQAAAFIGLTMVCFALDVREALTMLGLLVVALAVLMAIASLTLWALAWEVAPAAAAVFAS